MKTTARLITVLLLVLALLGEHGLARAGGGGTGTSSQRFKGRSADAYFSSIDTSGCIFTDVGLFASEGMLRSRPGPSGPARFLSIFIYRADFCTGEVLIYAYGESYQGLDLTVNPKLNSASLASVITLYDAAHDTYIDAAIDLSWTAAGPVSKNRASNSYSSPGCTIRSRFQGSSRFAQARGSVSVNGDNLTPEPSLSALLTSSQSGTLYRGCI